MPPPLRDRRAHYLAPPDRAIVAARPSRCRAPYNVSPDLTATEALGLYEHDYLLTRRDLTAPLAARVAGNRWACPARRRCVRVTPTSWPADQRGHNPSARTAL